MNKTLYTSKEVRGAIDQIFDDKHSRRVAVVAYLGVNAAKYLKSPKGMEIICCPEPGATSPKAIRELDRKGADVKFSEQLHAKVYWSDRGCVITSANLSDNALGASKQKEAGIRIDSKDVDIARLLKEVEPYNVNQKDMDKLDRGSRMLGQQDVNAKSSKETDTFISWYESLCRQKWKIGWWDDDDEVGVAKSAQEKSLREYGVDDPHALMFCDKKNEVKKNDWMLCFKIIKNSGIDELEWLRVDFVVPVTKSDKDAYDKNYPYQAIQVRKLKPRSLPPFKIDPKFKKAFKKAVNEYGTDKIKNRPKLKPNKKLLEYVKKHITV